MANQFVPPNGIPLSTIVGTDGMTLEDIVNNSEGSVRADGGDVSKTTALSLNATTDRALEVIFADAVNALDYGVTADSADNAVALQAAINAASSSGKRLYIPSGVYKYTPPMVIPGPLHITGDGCLPLFGSLYQDKLSDAINIPMVEPYFAGTVLRPASNGQSAFTCSLPGVAVSGTDFAISFQKPFVGTGHMLDYQPAKASNGMDDMGLMGGVWYNVGLYGHDGDHYMFNCVNPLYNTIDSCKAFGGGFADYSASINGGNSAFIRCLSMVIVGGTAHGYKFSTIDDNHAMQLNSLIGIQCITDSQPFTMGITPSAPTASQKLLLCDKNCHYFSIVSPDFETLVGSSSTLPLNSFIDFATNGFGGGYTYPIPDPVSFATDYLQAGTKIQTGTVTATGTTGTVTFSDVYYHSTPIVLLTGYGIDAKLSADPEYNQFSYELSATGSFGWVAFGR